MSRTKHSGKRLGQALEQLAAEYDFTVLSADTGTSTGAIQMQNVDPSRYVDVGCSEQQLVSEAEAHALLGRNVIAATFGQFLTNRAREQLVSLSQLHSLRAPRSSTILLGTHTGLSAGKDDMSHHGINVYELAGLPNLTLMDAADHEQAEVMLRHTLEHPGLYYIATPKEAESTHRRNHRSVATNASTLDGKMMAQWAKLPERGLPALDPERLSQPHLVHEGGRDGLILATGLRTYDALDAARLAKEAYGATLTVAQLPSIAPMDEDALTALLAEYRHITVVEENLRGSSVGQRVKALMHDRGLRGKVTQLCLDGYSPSDSYCALLEMNGLDTASIAHAAGHKAAERREARRSYGLGTAVAAGQALFLAGLAYLVSGEPAAFRGCRREENGISTVAVYQCPDEREYPLSFPDRVERHPDGTVTYRIDMTPGVP